MDEFFISRDTLSEVMYNVVGILQNPRERKAMFPDGRVYLDRWEEELWN